MIQKVSLKFSAWTMSKVDVVRQAICIRDDKVLKFWAEDFHKMFGVPCGNRDVKGRDASITQESIYLIKKSIGLDRAGEHSLHAVEEFLKRDVKDESSKIEKDFFQIAFVIFVMGHIFAPSVRELTTLWAFPLHVYLYKNYNPNHKWEITTIRTLHDLEDQGVMSHNVTYLWQSCHIM
jgi:hypothetical protein